VILLSPAAVVVDHRPWTWEAVIRKHVPFGGLAALLSASLLAGATGPAQAADSDTTVTFSVADGGLSISAPTLAALGTVSADAASVTGSLGTVTVNDQRGEMAAVWTVTVSASAFTTGGGSAAETIPAGSVTYTPGPRTAGNAVIVPTPGLLNLPLPVVTATASGNNTASWQPTISIALPAQAVAGDYTGTITHSVS
jgi:hypothetical protein